MTALTTILALSESVSINDHRFVGQSVSRNQKIFTSEIITFVPFSFTFKPNNYQYYSKSRNMLAELRVQDKSLEQYLNFGQTGWLNYVAYQGQLTFAQITACQWSVASSAKNLVLSNLPTVASTTFIVKAGDFCQVGRYAYIATADVQRGSGTTVTIPVHRGLITPLTSPLGAVIGQYGTTIALGGNTYTGVTFPVVLRSYPTYTLNPITNDSFVSWGDNFIAMEAIL